jgi:hypothetical protein
LVSFSVVQLAMMFLAMPLLLNDSSDWHTLALETLRTADQTGDPATKAWLLGIAKEYERLAERAARRSVSNMET